MALVRALLALLLIAFTTASSRIRHEHHPVKIPLHQRQHNDKVVRQTSHVLNEETAQSHDTVSSLTDESLDFGIRHWWFGNFDVGDAKNLSLQIDTASSSLAINPGLYRPSTKSKSLHHTGILSYGTWQKNGCGAADLQFSTYVDVVGMPGLVAEHQAFGSLVGEPPEGFKTQFPHDGIAGMSIGDIYGHKTWFKNVCDQNLIEECRFGLALGTEGRGQQVFGGIDESLFEGELTSTPYPEGWQVNVVINGKDTLIYNQTAGLFDSGTANIIVPTEDASKIFDELGIRAVETRPSGCRRKVLVGYYSCDDPPQLGIQFLSPTAISDKEVNGPVYNIEPEAFELANNGDNNCTAVIEGWENHDFWTVGQAWFQGKYLDHNAEGLMVGVAALKDKTGRGGA